MLPVTPPDDAIPPEHPLRRMKELVYRQMAPMRPLLVTLSTSWTLATPPDQGLLAIVLMAVYGIQTDAELCASLATDPDLRWFLGTTAGGQALDPTMLAQVRTRLLRNSAAREFLEQTMQAVTAAGLLADPHFAPDGRQIDAWVPGVAAVRPRLVRGDVG